MNTKKHHFLGLLIAVAAFALFGAIVMLLWNALLPVLFKLPAVNYLQALGLLLLVSVLFGFGSGLMHTLPMFFFRGGRGRRMHGNPFREKWLSMSEDERKEFMQAHYPFGSSPYTQHQMRHPENNEEK
jgi:hypothetical protein